MASGLQAETQNANTDSVRGELHLLGIGAGRQLMNVSDMRPSQCLRTDQAITTTYLGALFGSPGDFEQTQVVESDKLGALGDLLRVRHHLDTT